MRQEILEFRPILRQTPLRVVSASLAPHVEMAAPVEIDARFEMVGLEIEGKHLEMQADSFGWRASRPHFDFPAIHPGLCGLGNFHGDPELFGRLPGDGHREQGPRVADRAHFRRHAGHVFVGLLLRAADALPLSLGIGKSQFDIVLLGLHVHSDEAVVVKQ